MLMPYLNFKGNCEEAFRWYTEVFGGEIEHISRYGEAPGTSEFPVSEAQAGKVMHAQMRFTEGGFMSGSDSMAETADNGSVWLQVHMDKESTAREAGRLLAKEGTTVAELAKNPPPDDDSVAALIIDKYGIRWIISASAD